MNPIDDTIRAVYHLTDIFALKLGYYSSSLGKLSQMIYCFNQARRYDITVVWRCICDEVSNSFRVSYGLGCPEDSGHERSERELSAHFLMRSNPTCLGISQATLDFRQKYSRSMTSSIVASAGNCLTTFRTRSLIELLPIADLLGRRGTARFLYLTNLAMGRFPIKAWHSRRLPSLSGTACLAVALCTEYRHTAVKNRITSRGIRRT
jgi:hypothetical protein